MACKNCNQPLKTDHSYCSHCGAKVIRNRLSFKNLWYDITERYFNLDNTFLKTFWHLFTKPEVVIMGYIDGVRKRYLNPIGYFGIALTLSGLLVFLIRKVFMDDIGMDIFDIGADQQVFRDVFDSAMDFQAFVFVILIPMLAFPSWLLFNSQRHIFSEHLVSFTYIQAHYTIATFPISILVLSVAPNTYTSYGVINVLVMLLYSLYVFKRITSYGLGQFLFRAAVFLLLFVVEYFLVSNLIFLVLLFTGFVSLDSFRPG